MNTGACQLLYTNAIVRCNALVHFYDLWTPQKYQNQLKISVRLCDTVHWCLFTTYGHRTNTDTNYKYWCVCLIRHTDAFL